jgi:aryl-alcohol dehydrogenase-like predicted oxidoreductase
MRSVTLGVGGPPVGIVGLGCMGMSWAYDPEVRDDAGSVQVIHEAIAEGVSFLDTSDQYGPFVNEELVGRALQGYRDQVVVATKGGLVVRPDGTTVRDGSPEHLRQAHRASLRRLRTDHVNLYQLHRVDPRVELEESWAALAEFVEQGTARAIGLSEVTVDEIERARAIHPVASVQTELSLWSRAALDEVLPYCLAHGITFIAYAPLGRGFLTGRYAQVGDLPAGDWRLRNPRFSPEAMAANGSVLAPVVEAAERLELAPSQVALAWVLAQGEIAAIPGTNSAAHLRENVAAADLALPPDVLESLTRVPEPVGARY